MVVSAHARARVMTEFVTPMIAAFPRKDLRGETGISAAAEQYIQALGRCSVEQLRGGFVKVRDEREWAGWPSIAECVKACAQAARWEAPTVPPQRVTVDEAMRSEIGQEAVRSGFAADLVMHVREWGTMPGEKDLAGMRRAAGTAMATLRSLEADPEGFKQATFLRQQHDRIERETALARMYAT